MNRQDAYQYLNDKHVQWGRSDKNHIFVWTRGFKTGEHYDISSVLRLAGLILIKDEFDKICGKTKGVYYHE